MECSVLQLVSTACESMEREKKIEMAPLFDKEPVSHNVTWKTQRNEVKEYSISEEMKQISKFYQKKKDLELKKTKGGTGGGEGDWVTCFAVPTFR